LVDAVAVVASRAVSARLADGAVVAAVARDLSSQVASASV